MNNDIQRLREVTGAGVMDCKKALSEAKGNFDEAVKVIQKQGFSKMEKRAGRETGAGLVEAYVHNERIGVLLDIRAETDFVVRSEPFKTLAHDLVLHISAVAPQSVEELLSQPFVKNETQTIAEIVKDVVAKVGENIKINKFYRIEV